MNKKLENYIKKYELLENYQVDIIQPDGGMAVLINLGNDFDYIVEEETYTLKKSQTVLINALEKNLYLNFYEKLVLIHFQGAGASFFFDEHMEPLMFEPKKPIVLEEEIINEFDKETLNDYFQKKFQVSHLPFNIMTIIELLNRQGCDYCMDEVLSIANVPRKTLDKAFRLKTGLTIKHYAHLQK